MELIVFTGIPAAGKSTFFRQRFFDTHVRVNLDMLRTREREDVLLYACFAAKQPVVVDNTNPTAAQRVRYAKLGQSAGFKTALYYFPVTSREAAGRNAARNATRPKNRQVPNVAIFGTLKKFQVPTWEEGFERIYEVTSTGPDAFDVKEWERPT